MQGYIPAITKKIVARLKNTNRHSVRVHIQGAIVHSQTLDAKNLASISFCSVNQGTRRRLASSAHCCG